MPNSFLHPPASNVLLLLPPTPRFHFTYVGGFFTFLFLTSPPCSQFLGLTFSLFLYESLPPSPFLRFEYSSFPQPEFLCLNLEFSMHNPLLKLIPLHSSYT